MLHLTKYENFKKVNENHDYKTEIFYDDILSGSEANENDAIDRARGMDWMGVESSERRIAYMNYVDSVNGVGVWYCYGSDDYYFSDETEK